MGKFLLKIIGKHIKISFMEKFGDWDRRQLENGLRSEQEKGEE